MPGKGKEVAIDTQRFVQAITLSILRKVGHATFVAFRCLFCLGNGAALARLCVTVLDFALNWIGLVTKIAAKAAVTDETGLLFKLILETIKHSKY